MKKRPDPGTQIALFEQKTIRRELRGGEWWFSIIDVVEVLAGTENPRRYWSDLKRKLKAEGYAQVYERIVQLKMTAADGKKYLTDAANTETLHQGDSSGNPAHGGPFNSLFGL
jgi:prophage antirepressor-like protein